MTGRELNSGIARTFSLRGGIYELYEYCSIKQGDFLASSWMSRSWGGLRWWESAIFIFVAMATGVECLRCEHTSLSCPANWFTWHEQNLTRAPVSQTKKMIQIIWQNILLRKTAPNGKRSQRKLDPIYSVTVLSTLHVIFWCLRNTSEKIVRANPSSPA